MARRTVLLMAAVVLAALGALLVVFYVRGVNDRALAKQHPVKVLVAKKLIAAGTSGAQAARDGDLEVKSLAAAAVASGALDSTEAIATQVALAPIYPGEQILRVKFGSPGDVTALSVPTGMLAVSVTLDSSSRVGGFAVPGSEVAVFVTANNSTRLLLPKAMIIAVGQRTIVPNQGTGTSQDQSSIVTFALDETDAQKLIFAQSTGRIYLSLLAKDSSAPSLPATTAGNLFGQ